jgi:hypothetical protein
VRPRTARLTISSVLRFLRLAVRALLTFLAVGAVVGIGEPNTGPFEKAALAIILVAIVLVSIPVARIGTRSP